MVQPVHVIDECCDVDTFEELRALGGPDAPVFCAGRPPEFASPNAKRIGNRWWRHDRVLQDASAKPESVIHCWSVEAALAASEAIEANSPLPVVIRCQGMPSSDEQEFLQQGGDHNWRLSIVCATPALKAQLQAAGVREDLRVIPPYVVQMEAAPQRQARELARQRLGIAAKEKLVVTPAWAGRTSGHKFGIWSSAILSVAEFPLRLAFRGDAPAERAAMGFARDAGFAELLRLAELPLGQLLAAADLALFLNQADLPPQPIVATMLSGVPIVGPDTASARSWLENEQTALLVDPRKPRAIAQALMRLLEHPELSDRLARQAQGYAQQHLGSELVRQRWQELYALLLMSTAGRTIT